MTTNAITDALDCPADSIKTLAAALRQEQAVARPPSAREEPAQSPKRLILTPRQLAAELNVAEQTLAKWRLSGMGPRYRKFGRLVRYAVCTEHGAETLNCEGLIPGAPQDGAPL